MMMDNKKRNKVMAHATAGPYSRLNRLSASLSWEVVNGISIEA